MTSACGHLPDTHSSWGAPEVPGFCRTCSEKIEIARRCSTDALLALYKKVGTDTALSLKIIALRMDLPATREADPLLENLL